MSSSRLEAFSDGVLAIIITIMVLELHDPGGDSLRTFLHTAVLPLLTYVISFAYVGIYWTNHHHMFHVVEKVDGPVLWANLHLLFWLSLFPFTTSWMDDTRLARIPVVIYGANLLAAAAAYYLLERVLLNRHDTDSRLRQALNGDSKAALSPLLYGVGILFALLAPMLPSRLGVLLALVCYVLVALLWIVPDRRVERSLASPDPARNPWQEFLGLCSRIGLMGRSSVRNDPDRRSAMSDTTVTKNPEGSRYEARVDGALAGFAEYTLANDLVVFTHTEVDPSFEGKGIGSAIARYALDDVRAGGTSKVLSVCPFIKSWIIRHPEYSSLVYSGTRHDDPGRQS